MGMKQSHTTPYHPHGNAGPELFNRILLDMLGTLEEDQKNDWKKYLNSLVYFYNSTPHETTRYLPYQLMFGRHPKLPIDSTFEMATEEINKGTKKFFEDFKERLEKTNAPNSPETLEKEKDKQARYYSSQNLSGRQSIIETTFI